ncbi:MAG: S8 family serine peptidase [bacterium]
MQRMILCIILLLFSGLLFAEQSIKKVRLMQDGKNIEVEAFADRLLINFASKNENEIAEMLAQYGLQIEHFIGLHNWSFVRANADQDLMNKLKSENPDLIRDIEFDLVVRKFSTPNDSLFTTQWYLSDSLNYDIDWLVTCKVPPGDNDVLVGILDTGIAAEFDPVANQWKHHPDLPGFDILLPGKDFSPENEGQGIEAVRDLDGHGTFVTGEIFAKSNNGIGIAGLLNGNDGSIKALIHQVFQGVDGNGSVALVAAAVKDMVDKGVSVINFSGGGFGYSAIMEDAVRYAYDRNVIIVVSAGNMNELGITYPARLSRIGVKSRSGYANIIAVGATDRHDKRAYFSSWGPELCFVAPGERTFPVGTRAEDEIGIVSTTPWYPFASEDLDWQKHYFKGGRGTSFAAPVVTALVAMLLSYDKNLSPVSILRILIGTADRVGDEDYQWDGQGWFNPYYGYGKVNFRRALNRFRGIVVTEIEEKVDNSNSIPAAFELFQNYPNPFNPETKIQFQIPEASQVILKVYNILGKEIRTLTNAPYAAGSYSLRWDGRDAQGRQVASGIYLYQIIAGEFVQVRKMSLLR